jgi:hypothetical protein
MNCPLFLILYNINTEIGSGPETDPAKINDIALSLKKASPLVEKS